MYGFIYDQFLCHYGVPGMKWGIRRFQNKDGSLTQAGRKRYSDSRLSKAAKKELERVRSSNDPAIQKKFLEEAGSIDPTPKQNMVGSELMKDISRKSGDWYFGESKTKRNADAQKRLRSAEENVRNLEQKMEKLIITAKIPPPTASGKVFEKYSRDWHKQWSQYYKTANSDPKIKAAKEKVKTLEKDLAKVVLTDIGFVNNDDNVELIMPFIYWD